MVTETDLLREALQEAREQEDKAKEVLDMSKEVVDQYRSKCGPGSPELKSVEDDYDILVSSHDAATAKVSAILSQLKEFGHEEDGRE